MTTSKPLNPFILLNDLLAAVGSIKDPHKAKAAENSKPANFWSTLLAPFSIFTSRRQLSYEALDLNPAQAIEGVGVKNFNQCHGHTSKLHREIHVARLM